MISGWRKEKKSHRVQDLELDPRPTKCMILNLHFIIRGRKVRETNSHKQENTPSLPGVIVTRRNRLPGEDAGTDTRVSPVPPAAGRPEGMTTFTDGTSAFSFSRVILS